MRRNDSCMRHMTSRFAGIWAFLQKTETSLNYFKAILVTLALAKMLFKWFNSLESEATQMFQHPCFCCLCAEIYSQKPQVERSWTGQGQDSVSLSQDIASIYCDFNNQIMEKSAGNTVSANSLCSNLSSTP